MPDLVQLAHKVQKFAIDNSPLLLTVVGVTGAVSSAVLTGRASFRAAEMLQMQREMEPEYVPEGFGIIKLVWPEYLPAAGVLVLTCGAIVMSHQIGTRRAAALAAAYSLSEKALVEYREKIVEQLGTKKEQAVRDEIVQKHVSDNPKGLKEVIISSGEVLCYDDYSGRYFNSTVEKIRQAMNDINEEIMHNMYCSLTDFYSKIGLPQTTMSEEVGWNIDNTLAIHFSTTMSNDGRPCVSITFNKTPVRDYHRVW